MRKKGREEASGEGRVSVSLHFPFSLAPSDHLVINEYTMKISTSFPPGSSAQMSEQCRSKSITQDGIHISNGISEDKWLT